MTLKKALLSTTESAPSRRLTLELPLSLALLMVHPSREVTAKSHLRVRRI
jgi:hypothetical protein